MKFSAILTSALAVTLSLSAISSASAVDVATSLSDKTLETILTKGIGVKITQVGKGQYKFPLAGLTVLITNKGTDVQLYAGFRVKPTLAKINEWNMKRRFCRAYIDNDGDAVLESDFDFEGGVTEGGLAEFFKAYITNVKTFAEFIGYKG